jgi:hypothetical protein
MDICTEVVPPEVTFDGVRVACHLYPQGSDGVPITVPPEALVGHDAPPSDPDPATTGVPA